MVNRQLFLPWYISCGGRNWPSIVTPKTAVIYHLSPSPAIGTFFEPSLAIVHEDAGTYLRLV